MTCFARFVAEGSERADGMATYGTMFDGGEMAQIRASTVQQRGVFRGTAVRSSLTLSGGDDWHDCEELKPNPKDKWIFVEHRVEAQKHRTEWCAATSTHCCMRCGRNSEKMKLPGQCEGPQVVGKDGNHKLKIWGTALMGEHDMV